MNAKQLLVSSIAAATLLGLTPLASAKTVKIKLGTMAPKKTVWHTGITKMGERWKKATGGKVKLKIYAGGVLGDESDMIRKMRVGQLHAATVTGVGLGMIHKSTYALQIPMMMNSYEELDCVREQVGPEIAAEFENAGFKILHWGDAGWVNLYSTKPAKTINDFKDLKFFVWAGDPGAVEAWKSAKFNPIPMSSTDVMSGLQTGLINSFGTTPLYALSSQWFGLAKNMVQIGWSPLNGATIISLKKWNELVAAGDEAELLKISLEEGLATKTEVRALGPKAIKAMVDRGLSVHTPTPAERAEYRAAAEAAYPVLRGKVIPTKYFDRVQSLVKECRAKGQ